MALLAATLLFVLPVNWRGRRIFTLGWTDAARIDWGTILLFGGGLALGHRMFETGVAAKIGEGLVAVSLADSLWTITAVMTTVAVFLHQIKQMVKTEGAEKGLASLFENNSSAYQLFEGINVSPIHRSFPCPYKEAIEYCRQFLGGFTITWENVCSRWCTPTWTGCAAKLGIKISVHPGETCEVKLIS